MPDGFPPIDIAESVDDVMAPLPAGYRQLLVRVVESCARDLRIRGLWLGGSLARGVADAGSDLDTIVAVADHRFEDFAGGWREWLHAIEPTLLAQELPGMPGSFIATTADCLRLDLVAERTSQLSSTPYRARLVLIDRDGLDAQIPEPVVRPGPDPEVIASLVEEFYRQQAIFPAAVVARRDWLLGVVAVHNTQVMLYQLFAACNEPLPPMGVKQWSSRLTPSQREVLVGLAQPGACSHEVVAAMQEVRTAFRGDGRRTVESLGMGWPADVDRAVAAYWARQELG